MNNPYYDMNMVYTQTLPLPPVFDSRQLSQSNGYGFNPSPEMYGSNPWPAIGMRDRISSYDYWSGNDPMGGYQNGLPLYHHYGQEVSNISTYNPNALRDTQSTTNNLNTFHTRVPYTSLYGDNYAGAMNTNAELTTDKSASQNVKEPNAKIGTLASGKGNNKEPKRSAYKGQQIKGLELYFVKNKYPSRIEKVKLAVQLGLSESQVKVWFQNRRSKYRKETSTGDRKKDQAKSFEGCPVHED